MVQGKKLETRIQQSACNRLWAWNTNKYIIIINIDHFSYVYGLYVRMWLCRSNISRAVKFQRKITRTSCIWSIFFTTRVTRSTIILPCKEKRSQPYFNRVECITNDDREFLIGFSENILFSWRDEDPFGRRVT